MAEEVDIRQLWQKSKEKQQVADINLDGLRNTKTKTTLYWVGIILRIELWINIILLPFTIYYIYKRPENTVYSIVYILIIIAYIFYYIFLIKQISRFNYDGNVTQSLRKIYGYLRFYLLHYKVIIWISVIIGYIYGYYDLLNKNKIGPNVEDPNATLIFLIAMTIYSLLIGLLVNLVIHLVYGRKIKRLKAVVMNLEKTE